ncbi:MAG: hypothetical protein MUO26_16000 [Methanotrichaceae archaeon]|nr:hypothetical protein [Methanotrichaceae archaeon]
MSYKDFHRLYQKVGGKRDYQTSLGWAKGNVLGPIDPMDLYHIGNILDNIEIIDNYKIIDREIRKMRILHQNIGRKLKYIIKKILNGEVNPYQLDYEEYLLYEKIKDGVFEVLEIEKRPATK